GQVHPAAAALSGHFADGGGEPAGAVIGDEPVQPLVACPYEEVEHPFLGDRIADLDGRDRRVLVQLFGGEGGAVDAVLADPSAGHDDQVARFDRLLVPRLAVQLGRHDSGGTAEDQRFAAETLVADDGAVDGRNPALVAAMFHPFDDPCEEPPRMQVPFRQRLVVDRVGKAQYIGVEDQLRSLAGAERIAVDPYDAGQRPAVRIESRRRIVGLNLEDQRVGIVEPDDPGVVLEYGEAEIARSELFPDILRGPLDEGLEKGFYLLFAAVFVLVLHGSGEDLVLAVLRPGLCQALQLHIGRFRSESDRSSGFQNLRIPVVGLDDLHLLQCQGQDPLFADPHELFVGDVQINLLNLDLDLNLHLGHIRRKPALSGELVCRKYCIALDQGVAEEAGGDFFDVVPGQGAGQQVLDRIVDPFRSNEFPAGQVFDRFPGGSAGVVRDPGPEAYFDGKVEIPGERGVYAAGLDDRVAERPCCSLCQFLTRETG